MDVLAHSLIRMFRECLLYARTYDRWHRGPGIHQTRSCPLGAHRLTTYDECNNSCSAKSNGEGDGSRSRALAWRIPGTGEPGGLQSMGLQRVGHGWVTSLPCIGEGDGSHSRALAWRIPGTGEPGGLQSMGSHRVGHDWSDSSSQV